DADEMEEGAYAGVIAGTGAPAVLRERLFRDEALYCFEAMQHAAFFQNKNLKYLYSGELGGFNTFSAMLVAIVKDLPIVDADGCGRACPGLDTTLANVHGVPSSPLVVASAKGDSIVAYPHDPFDGVQCEAIARSFCLSSGVIAAFGTWLANKQDLKNKLADGALTFAQTVGKKILEAKQSKGSAAAYISTVLPCRELCSGVITGKTLETKQGWDWGCNEITLQDGSKYYLDFKNENIVARDDRGNVHLTAPDHISVLDADTYTPLTNSDTKEGMRVQVLGMPVHKNWWASPRGVEVWRPYFACVGYDGDAVKF
ncbi:DUF917 domain-containing protein, partial [Christensenellaceae bacterium OttesenSCG-928-M15]|nr:DUF917 domain-containing protein [Christensenellaceae bacterium OttesenSCG-928-M15]